MCQNLQLQRFYQYFDNLDDLIVHFVEHVMTKIEGDFIERAPKTLPELWKFIDEVPYWTIEKHGKKYRLMYQVYTHPEYREYGRKFFESVDQRYTEYAKSLEQKPGILYEKLIPLIFILFRACVHYALFESEWYPKEQLSVLKETLQLFGEKYNLEASA